MCLVFDAFPRDRQEELRELASRYGAPLVRQVDLVGGPFNPVHPAYGRMAEVCLVVRRPNGKLLTGIKPFYPPGAFRLLTGGVEPEERILDALVREAHEETGLAILVRYFLVALSYRRDGAFVFATFAFLLEEVGGTLTSLDPDEPHEFREVMPEELDALADALEAAPDVVDPQISGNWRDWGRFRAAVHRAVRDAL